MIIIKIILIIILNTIIKITGYEEYCSVIVPNNPLTEIGLSTPYILKSFKNSSLNCNIGNNSIFIEAVILDLNNGNYEVYNPIIIDEYIVDYKVIKPIIPENSIIGIWFSSNNLKFRLTGSTDSYNIINSVIDGNCIDGIENSPFGNFAYCNAYYFFLKANSLVNKNIINIKPLKNNCLTTRSYAFIPRYEISSISSYSYIILDNNTLIQNEIFNITNNYKKIININSNNRLLNDFINPSTNCIINNFKNCLAFNEIYSSYTINENNQALIPYNHPNVLVNGKINLEKLNYYRIGFNQKTINTVDNYENVNFCNNIYNDALNYMYENYDYLNNFSSPDYKIATNLLNYICNRFIETWKILDCENLTNNKCPIIIEKDYQNITISNNILYLKNLKKSNNFLYIIFPIIITIIVIILLIILIIYIINIRRKIKIKKYTIKEYKRKLNQINLDKKLIEIKNKNLENNLINMIILKELIENNIKYFDELKNQIK